MYRKGDKRGEFPEKKKVESSHTHNLADLVKVADLDKARLEYSGTDATFRNNWDVVRVWSEQSRYQRHSHESARTLLAAIGDRRRGVITWIKQRW